MDWWISEGPDVRTQLSVVDTIRIANNKLVQVIKMGDVYLVIAVAKDNVTMLAKLTEEEMGLTEAEICNGKTPGQNGEKVR